MYLVGGKPVKMRALVVLTLGAALVSGVLPARARRMPQQAASPYDMSKKITLTGTVEEFDWGAPKDLLHIHLAVKGKNGQIEHWVVEAEPPELALKDGWTQDMMKPGDQVTYEVSPAIKGGFKARGGTTITINGKRMGTVIHPETITIPAVHVQ